MISAIRSSSISLNGRCNGFHEYRPIMLQLITCKLFTKFINFVSVTSYYSRTKRQAGLVKRLSVTNRCFCKLWNRNNRNSQNSRRGNRRLNSGGKISFAGDTVSSGRMLHVCRSCGLPPRPPYYEQSGSLSRHQRSSTFRTLSQSSGDVAH